VTATGPQGLVWLRAEDRVATITLDSPANRNALSRGLMAELLAQLQAARDDAFVASLVLTGTGSVFCAGADLAKPVETRLGDASLPKIVEVVWQYPKPLVVRQNGHARGGGGSDLPPLPTSSWRRRLRRTPSARFASVSPRGDRSGVCARRMHQRPLLRYGLTGDVFDAYTTRDAGLVTMVVALQELGAAVARLEWTHSGWPNRRP
jgi:methylglutaconyl-CoA hydratase